VRQFLVVFFWLFYPPFLRGYKNIKEREFYITQSVRHSWSRYTLIDQINSKAYTRYIQNQTNFEATLPEEYRANALLAVKDDYNFDFLNLSGNYAERELEEALTRNIVKLLAEMGGYFAFVGRQFKIEVNNEEYFIDLLFYHRQLRCLVAIDLKTGKFEPEYAGKMQFYLGALNNKVRLEGENPSIGIIVCRDKDRTVVEYTLQDVNKPIGIATYKTYSELNALPEKISKYLPSEGVLEERLADLPEENQGENKK
jgi:predicted nuclease of restriction endonuclease-like (RecB) superfamily